MGTAWGEVRYNWGSTPTDYTYTGQYSNVPEFGLYYYNARWYDGSLGRFAQADTIIPLESQGVQAWDRYAGMNNNPVRYSDPSGHFILGGIGEAILIGAGIGAVVSTAAYVGVSLATGSKITAGGLAGAAVGGAIGGAVSVIAAPLAGSIIAGAASVVGVSASTAVTATSLAVGGALVNAAGGVAAYYAGGAATNAVDTALGESPSFEPTPEGALGSAALAGVLAYGLGKASPVSMNAGQKSLTHAYYSLPGRTLKNALWVKPQGVAQSKQVIWAAGIGTSTATGWPSILPKKEKLYCD